MRFEWIQIDVNRDSQTKTWCAQVFLGWIIRTESWSNVGLSESMVFISDPTHEWNIDVG